VKSTPVPDRQRNAASARENRMRNDMLMKKTEPKAGSKCSIYS
jgi:hypothetical protein